MKNNLKAILNIVQTHSPSLFKVVLHNVIQEKENLTSDLIDILSTVLNENIKHVDEDILVLFIDLCWNNRDCLEKLDQISKNNLPTKYKNYTKLCYLIMTEKDEVFFSFLCNNIYETFLPSNVIKYLLEKVLAESNEETKEKICFFLDSNIEHFDKASRSEIINNILYIEYLSKPFKSKFNPERFYSSNDILIICPNLPDYDTSSGGNRLFQIIKCLHQLEYDIHIFAHTCFKQAHREAIQNFVQNICVYNEDGKDISEFLKSLTDNKIQIQFCVYEFYSSHQIYRGKVEKSFANIKHIIDSVDIHWKRLSRGVAIKQVKYQNYIKLKTEEKKAYTMCDAVLAVTKEDEIDIIKETNNQANVKIVSNIHYPEKPIDIGNNIVFVGGFSHPPNIDSAKRAIHIFLKFKKTDTYKKLKVKPKLYICGNSPPLVIRYLCFLHSGIECLGYVKNLRSIHELSKISISPLSWGAGIKGKVCNASMHGVPILTSEIGNEGINLTDNVDGFIANSNDEFVTKLEKIFETDNETLKSIAQKGKDKILKLTSADVATQTLKNLFSRKEIIISIVTFNNHKELYTCLVSIFNRTIYRNYKIVISDNSTNDCTKNMLEVFPEEYRNKIIYVKNSCNEYFIKPNNNVMYDEEYENSDILLLNDDTVIQSNYWLTYLHSAAYSSNEIGFVGGKTIYPNGFIAEAGAEIYNSGYGRNIGRGDDPEIEDYNKPKYTGYCSGCLLYIKRDVINKIGGFSTKLEKMYYEDTELQYRGHIFGYKTYYEPKCVVIHNEGSTSGTDINTGTKQYQEINRKNFIKIFHGWDLEKYNA